MYSNRRYVGQYAEPRPTGSNYSSDYELNVRSRYETNGMISPINGNSQFTISSPQEGMEDSRDDSGYFDKMSRKPSMDADAAVWPTHPPLTVDTNNRTPLWAVTPQSQRSSTSSTETQQKQQQQQQQYVYQQQQKQQNGLWPVQSTSDLSLGSSLGETIVNSNGLWPVHQDMPQLQPTTPTPMPSLWAVPPKQPQKQEETITTSQSLWAIPPSNRSSATLVDSSFESKATPTTITSSVSLWAVSPSNVPAAPTPTPSLWAIAPQQPQQPPQETDASSPEAQQFGSENLNLHPSISGKIYSTPQPKQQRGVQFSPMIEQDHNGNDDASSTASAPTLEEGIEGISLTDPSPKLSHHHSALHIDTTAHAIDDSRSPIPSPSTTIVDSSDEENWAERPSVERLYKDIDKYLPGHDLDKEIIVEPVQTPAVTPSNPTMVAALPPGRRLGGHKKSIRNVAHEAHRNWRNAVNVIRANNLIRRRSTKMWHRNVEQVKPGMKADIQTSDTKPSKL
jgi:hypothetical protein